MAEIILNHKKNSVSHYLFTNNYEHKEETQEEGVSSLAIGKNGEKGFASINKFPCDFKRLMKISLRNLRRISINDNDILLPEIKRKELSTKLTFENKFVEFNCKIKEQVQSCFKKSILERRIDFFQESLKKRMWKKEDNICENSIQREYIILTSEDNEFNHILKKRLPFPCHRALNSYFKEMEDYLLQMRSPEKISDQEYICFLNERAASVLIHEAIGHIFEYDNSIFLQEKLEEINIPSFISVTDYANSYNGKKVPIPIFYDDEFSKAKDIPLIKNGSFGAFMNDTLSANINGQVISGNARSFMFSDEPLIRMRNTVLQPGKKTKNEILKTITEGLYISSVGDSYVNGNGEFSLLVTESYKITNGIRGSVLVPFIAKGTIFNFLSSIEEISDTLEWFSQGYCIKQQKLPVSMASPAIKCKLKVEKWK